MSDVIGESGLDLPEHMRADTCPHCMGHKYPGNSLCRRCYARLPRGMQNDLFKPIDDGYGAAIDDALEYLANPPRQRGQEHNRGDQDKDDEAFGNQAIEAARENRARTHTGSASRGTAQHRGQHVAQRRGGQRDQRGGCDEAGG